MATLQERMALGRQHYERKHNKKLKNVDMANYCKVSKASIGQWFNGPTKELDGLNLSRAAEYLNVSHKWLAGENVSMTLEKNNNDSEFENVRVSGKRLYKIPVLDFVQAGLFHDVGYDGINAKGETYTTYEAPRPKEVFSLEVSGLSMSPDFMPGDELVIDASLAPKPGSLVVAQNGGHESTFKKYRLTGYDEFGCETFELVPLNPDFPILSSQDHSIKIIGVLVQHLRRYKY